MNFEIIQNNIGYIFINQDILKVALTHKSYLAWRGREKTVKEHNERLEFLGDAVLELVVTDYLYNNYSKNEGYMTALRSSLVNYKIIGQIGIRLGLEDQILLSPGEKAELGKARMTIVADAVEAVIGAMYIDGGYGSVASFIEINILSELDNIIAAQTYLDAKTELQEYTQKNLKITPRYEVVDTEGKDHDKTFFVEVYIWDEVYGQASGKSKQEAETQCAILAVAKLKEVQSHTQST